MKQDEIRLLSYSNRNIRKICLQLGIIKYILKRNESISFYKFHVNKKIDRKGLIIEKQVSQGARIIGLNLCDTKCTELTEKICGPYIEFLDLSACSELKYVFKTEKIKYLNLLSSISNSINVGKFSSLEILLFGGKEDNYLSLQGIENLSKLKKIFLEHCNISNVLPFSTVNYAIFSCCPMINDISMFLKLQILTLYDCNGITELHGLTSLEELLISSCSNIVDISALSTLKNIKKIFITDCDGITEIIGFKNLNELKIKSCRNLTDITMISNTKLLSIINCVELQRISNITLINKCSIHKCNNIHEISLKESDYVTLFNSGIEIMDINISGINYLLLDQCIISDLSGLNYINNLSIHSCNNINDVSMITNVEKLNLLCCYWIDTVSGSINNLTLFNCPNLIDTSIISNVEILLSHPKLN